MVIDLMYDYMHDNCRNHLQKIVKLIAYTGLAAGLSFAIRD